MMEYINEHQDDSPRSDADRAYIQHLTEQLDKLNNQLNQEKEQSIDSYYYY